MSEEINFFAALDQDIWNSVYLPIPQVESPELLRVTHSHAMNCYANILDRVRDPSTAGISPYDPERSEQFGSLFSLEQHGRNALNRMKEIEKIEHSTVRYEDVDFEALNKPSNNENASDAGQSQQPELNPSTENQLPKGEITDRMQRLLDASASTNPDLKRDGDRDPLTPDLSDSGRDR